MKSDVIVVGGGIIGCSIALRLLRSGLRVTLIERGHPGCEASGAAAGMLSPQVGALKPDGFFDLCMRSRSLYPEFLEDLTQLTSEPVEYNPEGTLCLALEGEPAADLDDWATWQLRSGLNLEAVSREDIHHIEPNVTRQAVRGILVHGDHQLDNRQLMKVLTTALRNSGATLRTGISVESLTTEKGSVIGVQANGERYHAAKTVVAAGSWSGNLLVSLGLILPTTPARGQMIAFKGSGRPIRRTVHTNKIYVVPRCDGRVLAGATVEYAGFDKRVTPDEIEALGCAAYEAVPMLREFEIVEKWAGLRPDTPDHLPILGQSGIPGLVLATGHFRSGILLAPVTAELISNLILSGEESPELRPFDIARFRAEKNSQS